MSQAERNNAVRQLPTLGDDEFDIDLVALAAHGVSLTAL